LWSGSVRDLLVTGTDTGVGKTVIAAALVKALRSQGVRAVGFKPAETGIHSGEARDSELLARAAGDPVPLAAPLVQLAEALAPAVAADRAGVALCVDELETRMTQLRQAGYTLVVEGAGGLLVPLAWEKEAPALLFPRFYTVLDLAERCGLAVVIVARPGLGTLNHTALTVGMLRLRNIPIEGVVLNSTAPSPDDLAEATNPEALARMLPDVRIVSVPHHPGADVVGAAIPFVSQLVSRS
jgi:dethiobiotin synthetase